MNSNSQSTLAQLLGRPFRIVEFNVENLFIRLDHLPSPLPVFEALTEREWQKLSSSTVPNKPLSQVLGVARAIRAMNPDILMLCEVGGTESLANFSRYFLGDAYAPLLLEGNSDRGIDLGYLIKRDLPFQYDLVSHKNRDIDFLYPHEKLSQETGFDHLRSARVVSHKFSRDVLELRVFPESGGDPHIILMLVHLKSQLDRSRIDPGGRDRRKAELEKLIQIYNEIRSEFGGQVPVILGGDFNGRASAPNPEDEFKALYENSDLQDCLHVASQPEDERFTHMQIRGNRSSLNKQIDYLFLSPELFSQVDSENTWVFRFQREDGMTIMIPRNLNEKRALPSDHYPVVVTLK